MLLVRTEWTYVSRRIVHQSMPYHFVFALESFTALRARAVFYWAVVRPFLRMDVRVGASVNRQLSL